MVTPTDVSDISFLHLANALKKHGPCVTVSTWNFVRSQMPANHEMHRYPNPQPGDVVMLAGTLIIVEPDSEIPSGLVICGRWGNSNVFGSRRGECADCKCAISIAPNMEGAKLYVCGRCAHKRPMESDE